MSIISFLIKVVLRNFKLIFLPGRVEFDLVSITIIVTCSDRVPAALKVKNNMASANTLEIIHDLNKESLKPFCKLKNALKKLLVSQEHFVGRGGSTARSTCHSSKQCHALTPSSSQTPATPASGELMPSGLQELYTQAMHTGINQNESSTFSCNLILLKWEKYEIFKRS